MSVYDFTPVVPAGMAIQGPYGTFVPPPGRVAAYLIKDGVIDQGKMPQSMWQLRVKTLADALARCDSGYGDTVVVLPGHTENIGATALANLKAGTSIVGPQAGVLPTFTWNATTSKMAIAVAGVSISGLRFDMSGANGVVKAMEVTAADVTISSCDFILATGASNKATIAVEVGTGADRFAMNMNRFVGTETHNVTDGIKVVAAVRDMRLRWNDFIASATAGNGLIHITAAAKGIHIVGGTIYNTHTSSTACIAVDDVAADGIIAGVRMATLNNGTANAQGIVFAGTTPTIRCFENYSSDESRRSGALAPAVVAT